VNSSPIADALYIYIPPKQFSSNVLHAPPRFIHFAGAGLVARPRLAADANLSRNGRTVGTHSFETMDGARRRVAGIANHITAAPGCPMSDDDGFSRETYARADPSRGSSYERVHGNVSREPVIWIPCTPGADERTGATYELKDVIYEKSPEGIARVTINRPERRNAFTPRTVKEMRWCMDDARDDMSVGVVVLRGAGDLAFCSGGDQSARGKGGYVEAKAGGSEETPRLNVLDLQMQIRRMPKPVIASVAGYAVGGGHILHMVCDLTIAADNAVFGQTGPKVGSFDAGYGSTHMARLIGQKKAREMWFLARFYNASDALKMGLVNTVVPLAELEVETAVWCREILRNSPTAIRLCKNALNAAEDGQAGIQDLGGSATLLFYQSEEGNEGRQAFLEGRRPDFSKFKRFP